MNNTHPSKQNRKRLRRLAAALGLEPSVVIARFRDSFTAAKLRGTGRRPCAKANP
jgi:hypothetical protein